MRCLGAMNWLEGITKWDPVELSRLEYFLGTLDIDWTGGEASGWIYRPSLGWPPRGQLRAEVKRIAVTLVTDMYRGDPRRATARVRSFDVDLDVGHATVARALAARFDSPRPVRRDDREYLEYGTYYLACAENASALLSWYRARPEWAIPPRSAEALTYLLEVLLDRLICDDQSRAIFAALEPLVASAGCELRGVALDFKPPIALASVVGALRLDAPTASAHDVHQTSWYVETVGPDGRIAGARIGVWELEIVLEGYPRGPEGRQLPERGRAGPSPRLDLTDCVTRVSSISFSPPRR